MQNTLMQELDSKVRNLIEELEVLRVEINELKTANQFLSNERIEWEQDLNKLLGKFDKLG